MPRKRVSTARPFAQDQFSDIVISVGREERLTTMDSVMTHLQTALAMGEDIVDRNPNFCLTSEFSSYCYCALTET